MIYQTSPNATSSPESADGPTLCNSQDGQQLDLFGRVPVPASRSAAPVSKKPKLTPATFGRSSSISSASAALCMSLGNRLQARLGMDGSMEYRRTWNRKATPAGRSYWAHTASAHRISDSDYTGLPTASARDWKDTPGMATTGTNPDGSTRTRLDQLPRVAQMCGCPTPTAGNADGSQMAKDASTTGRRPDGSKATVSLNQVAQTVMAGWPTPQVAQGPNMSENRGTDHGGKRARTTAQSVEGIMKGWATPRAEDAESCGMRHSRGVADTLSAQAGQDLKSSIAGTEKPAALNPDHSRWLMGFPVEWGSCGATAMQSSRKSPRSSSRPTSI